MNNYLCSWEIHVSADSPQEAAKHAEDLMTRRQESTWTVKKVDSTQMIHVDVSKADDK